MIVIIGVVSCVLLCFEEDVAADVEDQVLWNLVLLYHFITLFFCYFVFFITFLVFTPRPADQVVWNLVTSPKLFYIIRNYSDRGISYLMDFQLYVIHIYVREGSRYRIG